MRAHMYFTILLTSKTFFFLGNQKEAIRAPYYDMLIERLNTLEDDDPIHE